MVEKLKSISKRIHWSLVLKAIVFAGSWFLLPFWLFCLIGLFLYLIPLFQARRLAVPFFVLFILCYLKTPGLSFFLIFGILFYLILLIKDLLLIDRRSAYELLVLALTFLLLREFYMRFNTGIDGSALLYAFLIAPLFTLLFRSFIRCFREDIIRAEGIPQIAIWLACLIFWQTVIVGLFLPTDFVYQSVIVFLMAILLVDLVPEYLFTQLSTSKVLTAATVVFGLLVIVLGSIRWGL